MNAANQHLEYYQSDDFKALYIDWLTDDFYHNKGDIIDHIQQLFNDTNYETLNYFENEPCHITPEKAKEIFDYIYKNISDFIEEFNGFFVGSTSLCSVSFGEQEESLEGIYNAKTNKEYGLAYMKRIFKEEGYYISGKYAYYVIDGGMHIELRNNKEQINKILTRAD